MTKFLFQNTLFDRLKVSSSLQVVFTGTLKIRDVLNRRPEGCPELHSRIRLK